MFGRACVGIHSPPPAPFRCMASGDMASRTARARAKAKVRPMLSPHGAMKEAGMAEPMNLQAVEKAKEKAKKEKEAAKAKDQGGVRGAKEMEAMMESHRDNGAKVFVQRTDLIMPGPIPSRQANNAPGVEEPGAKNRRRLMERWRRGKMEKAKRTRKEMKKRQRM